MYEGFDFLVPPGLLGAGRLVATFPSAQMGVVSVVSGELGGTE